ncbi:hypothetical protein BKA67DRAFT_655772 [Truncatella angustata]|uniref:Uncharacterized protein n=1 Tax=Truncatella angustata TaxID=152316 RepID=A0A9P8USF8_9PEZI|nr:uncharacterized protein BKA67DRAFT_655772 [Truncatella angustata]KAH6657508.1 hypothetical protein BKA67DRAFT_655772 [Truncatella angustata]
MRYEDWDVLLFPKDEQVPMKEFKTQCHVVHDNEFTFTLGSHGLPTMTCFMPALPTGNPFFISLHCWSMPKISQYTKSNFSKHENLVKLEARVFVDGRQVASAIIDRGEGNWPLHISHGFEFTKNGDLEHLKFPPFRSELLRQSYWSPADDLGRIKIVINILEASGIAWPNPAMWRRGPFNPTMQVPIEHPTDGSDSHVHSPRRRSAPSPEYQTKNASASFLGSMPNTQAFLQSTTHVDPFDSQHQSNDSSDFDWTTGLVSTDFATTLTNSLLNQPAPALRKTNSLQSPASARTFSGVFSSRSASGTADFGQDLANVNPVTTFMNADSNGDKVPKRSRNATPASHRALDEDEEPKRSTPHVRIGFGDDMAN